MDQAARFALQRFRRAIGLGFYGLAVGALGLLLSGSSVWSQEKSEESKPEMKLPTLGARLTPGQVSGFAELALKGMFTEYPNKPSNVMADAHSVQSPKEMHPAFFGCFDWHSSVHGHWMLVRLLREYPNSPVASRIRESLGRSLTKDNIQAEVEYFSKKDNKSFERMYGWAWYLRLVAELHRWDDEDGKEWRESLRPLEELLVERAGDYLPVLQYPIRTGIHPDSGFALGQVLDYARVVGNTKLEALIVKRGKEFYAADVDYPTLYEPSGQDFFSSCLNEADFMRRILSQNEFVDWLNQFLPGLASGDGGNLLKPVVVGDITDGHIVHLAGLDLSRAWCMEGIASALPDGDPRKSLLSNSAKAHAAMGFKYVFSGHYEGEHWLATFAIYLQARVGLE